MKKSKKDVVISKWYAVILIAVAILAGAIVFYSVNGLEDGIEAGELERLESALRHAAVSCYTTEGFYPPSLQYIEDEYGIQIDEDKFLVSYRVDGANLMPEIDVIPK